MEYSEQDDPLSSPLVHQDDDREFQLTVVQNHKSKDKTINDDNEDMSFWSSAKKTAYAAMKSNPNAYFYRHVAPGDEKHTGPWTKEEKGLFMEAMKVHPPSQGKWGLFASLIPGRVGYQCRNFYHHLLETGELKAQPGELEAIKRKKRPRKEGKEEKKPKKHEIVHEEVDEEEPEEKEQIFESEPEFNRFPEVEKIVFFSPRLEHLKAIGKELEDSEEYADFEREQFTQEPTIIEDPQPVIPQMNTPAISAPAPVVNDAKWSRRMKAPWTTLSQGTTHVSFVQPEPIEDLSARLMKLCTSHPINMLLLSVPCHRLRRSKYLDVITQYIEKKQQGKLDGILHTYFEYETKARGLKKEERLSLWDQFADTVLA